MSRGRGKLFLGVFLASLVVGGPSLWGEAPRTLSVTAENMVYVSGQANATTLTGRAMDADGDLSHISFYIYGPHPDYSEWTFVGTDYSASGYDATGQYEWTPPGAGTWHAHIRAYDLTSAVDTNANILTTFVAQSGVAPDTTSIIGEDIVYQSDRNATTTLTGRANDATDPVSRKLLLKSVTQVSGTSSTEPISFAYGESSAGSFSDNVGVDTQLLYNDSHDAEDNRVDAADFDGDGLTDLLVSDDGAYWLYRCTGTGFSRIA